MPDSRTWEALADYFAAELVDHWHASATELSLAEYMGLTDEMYSAWAECDFDRLADLLDAQE